MVAQASKTRDEIDRLIDVKPAAAARKIKAMSREQLEACLYSAVTSVDPRWRVPTGPAETPAARTDQITDRTRTAVRDILAENPASIVGVLLGAGDAIDAHDPRRRDQDDTRAAA